MNSFSQLLETAKRSPFARPFTAKCDSAVDSAPVAVGTMVPRKFSACAADEPVVYGSMKYFALCGFGGVLSCGITHTGIVPLDLVKCRIQTNAGKYKGIYQGFSVTIKEEGARGLYRGWAPTAIGYSLQGLGKFGFYEVFKVFYSNLLGEARSHQADTTPTTTRRRRRQVTDLLANARVGRPPCHTTPTTTQTRRPTKSRRSVTGSPTENADKNGLTTGLRLCHRESITKRKLRPDKICSATNVSLCRSFLGCNKCSKVYEAKMAKITPHQR